MDDCEVCLQPTFDLVQVTFQDDETAVPVRFCRECVTAIIQVMTNRYNEAIDQQNAWVDQLCRTLGIEIPPTEHIMSACPNCATVAIRETDDSGTARQLSCDSCGWRWDPRTSERQRVTQADEDP